MAVSPDAAPATAAKVRDHGFHSLRVAEVVRETADTNSLVFDVPADLAATFAYEPGQNITFRLPINGELEHRSYSMSSAPATDAKLAVTVKRVEGGLVSNWVNDNVKAGDEVQVTSPAGLFVTKTDRDVVAFAGGSGITPIFSIAKSVLATSERAVTIYYANRSREAVIFDAALDELGEKYADRLTVIHHLDTERGYVDPASIAETVAKAAGAECFVCGPDPFMDVVEAELLNAGVPTDLLHIERFVPLATVPLEPQEAAAAAPATDAIEVEITLNGKTQKTTWRQGTVILQTARSMKFNPPYGCEAGNCASCMAKLLEGTCEMHVNDALRDDEVEDGWILTCQGYPTSPLVRVSYDEES